MGVIYSMPMCSRGDPSKEANNNEPMPTLQHFVHTDQPLPTSISNQNVSTPDATSTPKDQARGIDLDLPSEDEEEEDEDEIFVTSDSGLEQSSSDELELVRPFSRANDDEGINVTVHEEDPVERPPEPTVPDERVDSADSRRSADSADRADGAKTALGHGQVGKDVKAGSPDKADSGTPDADNSTVEVRKGDTVSAISNLLSEIVGDRPYEQDQQYYDISLNEDRGRR